MLYSVHWPSLPGYLYFVRYWAIRVWGHSKSVFAEDSRVLTRTSPPPQSPLSPLFALVRFRVPPPHKVLSLWLELTLSPLVSILVKFREKKLILVSLVELNASFKKPQWNLCKVDTIGTWQKCPLYGDVRFIESPSKTQKFSKVNIKSTICHDFSSPKNRERLRKRQSFFHS